MFSFWIDIGLNAATKRPCSFLGPQLYSESKNNFLWSPVNVNSWEISSNKILEVKLSIQEIVSDKMTCTMLIL